MFAEFRCAIEISYAECWSSAALPIFCERNLESECFQNFHSGDADVRFVIAHKGVGPKDDVATLPKERRFATAGAIWKSPFLVNAGVTAPGCSVFCEPFVES